MKKKYNYNPQTFQDLLDRHGIRPVDLQKLFNYSNTITIKKWREGNPIYADKLCDICNAYDIDIHEFFTPAENQEETSYQTDFEERLENLAKEKKIKEKASGEKQNLDLVGVLEQVEAARVRERDYQEKLRKNEIEVLQKKRDEEKKAFDKRIQEKNEEILAEQKKTNQAILEKKELELKLEELTRQYQELELSTLKGASNALGVAEKHGYLPHLQK